MKCNRDKDKESNVKRRAPQGARGLKSVVIFRADVPPGRAPQGARGLKFATREVHSTGFIVAPRKGRVG